MNYKETIELMGKQCPEAVVNTAVTVFEKNQKLKGLVNNVSVEAEGTSVFINMDMEPFGGRTFLHVMQGAGGVTAMLSTPACPIMLAM